MYKHIYHGPAIYKCWKIAEFEEALLAHLFQMSQQLQVLVELHRLLLKAKKQLLVMPMFTQQRLLEQEQLDL